MSALVNAKSCTSTATFPPSGDGTLEIARPNDVELDQQVNWAGPGASTSVTYLHRARQLGPSLLGECFLSQILPAAMLSVMLDLATLLYLPHRLG
jgi:hypothetical protein